MLQLQAVVEFYCGNLRRGVSNLKSPPTAKKQLVLLVAGWGWCRDMYVRVRVAYLIADTLFYSRQAHPQRVHLELLAKCSCAKSVQQTQREVVELLRELECVWSVVLSKHKHKNADRVKSR